VHAQEYERSNVTVAAAILGALAGGTTAALLAIKKNIRETMNLTLNNSYTACGSIRNSAVRILV
jgi:hypothetical protein